MTQLLFVRTLTLHSSKPGTPYVAVNRFPINCIGFCIAAVELLSRPSRKACFNGKSENIMLTGGKMTKALQIARSFHAAGHFS